MFKRHDDCRRPFKPDRRLTRADRIFERLVAANPRDVDRLHAACVKAGLDVNDVVRRRAMRFA